jgi:hypothetical protein
MATVPRVAPMPAAGRKALEAKAEPPPAVLATLDERHQRLVTVYARLNKRRPAGAPKANKVLDR